MLLGNGVTTLSDIRNPLGYRQDGRPIYPILGAAEEGEGGAGGEDKAGEFKSPKDQADLDRIIGERVARERAKYADYGDLKAKAAEHDKVLEAAKDEATKKLDAARAEGRTEAVKAANVRLVRAEVRALAAELKFRDPNDAHRYLDDLGTVKVSDDGDVDGADVKRRLEELAKTKDYLVKGEEKPRKPKPDGSQGGNGGSQTAGVSAGRDLYEARRRKPQPTSKE